MPGPKQLSNQRVSVHKASTEIAALHVVQVDSTGGIISGGAGGGSTQVSVREILTSSGASVMDSTNNAIGVTIRAGSASGTEYTDGDVDATPSGGVVFFDNSSNTMRAVRIDRGLPVNVVAGSAASTTVQVSSVGGAVVMRSSAANALVSVYQSTAADLNVTVAGYVAPSTTAQVSSVGGRVAIAAFHAADGIVNVADSTNNAINVNVVAGAAAGSTEVTVRQSTVGALRAAVYQSTAADLNVTVAGYVAPSTTVQVSSVGGAVVMRSSAANALVSVYQSTAADLNVTVAGYVAPSTTVQVSSVGGAVIMRSSAANALVTVYQSTAADLQATARLNTSSGGAVEGSTASPAHGVIGIHVRQVPSSMATFAASTVGATSTNTTLVSSVAGQRVKVYAFSVTSTVIANSTVSFRSSAATVLWPLVLGTGSSGSMGANLAVAPPAFLFATAAANALTFHTPSSGPEFHVAVSYFMEP